MAIDLSLLMNAYAHGIFPMADDRGDAPTFWVEPKRRAIIPLDAPKISRSLKKSVKQDRFTVTSDTAFAEVMQKCGEQAADRQDTWINNEIFDAFCALHEQGHAHSVECWQDGALVGGLYGLALGRVFCGESMFSRRSDASKVALVWLIARLNAGGFDLLDCQFMTDHLQSLGAIEISQEDYLRLLARALSTAGRVDMPSETAQKSVYSPSDDAELSLSGDWAALDELLAAGGTGAASPSSSPGKRILHSFIQTS